MVDKNVFLWEVTIRICGSFQIITVLGSAFEYLRHNIPLDVLSLTIRDANLAALRRFTQVAADKMDHTEYSLRRNITKFLPTL